MNKQKGITLVALVITVIILLILAGTAISISTNGSNIFEKTNTAKSEWNEKVLLEESAVNKTINILKQIPVDITDSNPGTMEASVLDSDTYVINSIEDLLAFAYEVNGGDTFVGKTVKLGETLDFQYDGSYSNPNEKYIKDSVGYKKDSNGTAIKELLTDKTKSGFEPIGNKDEIDGFGGTFDGDGYSIINMYQNSERYGGLFGVSKKELLIKNVSIKSCDIHSVNPAGGILGWNYGTLATIVNCSNSGNITGSSITGGIVGGSQESVTIIRCHNDANLSGTVSGGIITNLYTSAPTLKIIECYNTGDISATNGDAAGIVTVSSSTSVIINSYNTGNIITNGDVASGIVGWRDCTIINCYNTGDVATKYKSSYSGAPVGGILGQDNNAKIMYCYNTGDISTDWTGLAGGITGGAGTIINCHNSGNITGDNTTTKYEVGVGYTTHSNCTYLNKTSVVTTDSEDVAVTKTIAQGETKSTFETAMETLCNNMNSYINEHQSEYPALSTWVIGPDGYPVLNK